jgi:hypothetical protein
MTPDEVRNLQKFAQANGTTLTINPTTGLPEAGLLSDLFKAVAPIALGAFLGPGAFGIAGLGMSAGMAGAAVGGLTTLATGSLSRGLMAGLGAYGGAGMAEGLATAGTNAMTTAGVGDYASSLAERGIYPTLESGAVNPAFGEGASQIALESQKQALAAPMTDRLSAGFSAATASPSAMGSFAKDNLKYLAAAASPIAADMMTPTTTKMPEMGNTGYIRQKIYDPYTQTYRSMAPVKANEWKDRQFSDIYRGASGGIVALAGGGVAHFDEGDLVKDKPTGLQTLTQAAPTYNQYSNQQIGDYLRANPTADIGAATALTNADPNAVNAYIAGLTGDFKESTATTAGSGTFGIYDQLAAQGLDPNEYFNALTASNPAYAGWSKEDITRGYQLDKSALELAEAQKGNVTDTDWVNFMDTGDYSVNDMAQAFGLSTSEVQSRYDAVKNAEAEAAAAARAEADRLAKIEADRLAKIEADRLAAEAAAKAKAEADAIAAAKAKAEADAISKRLADEAAVKAAAEKAAADKAIADAIAADEKAAAERAAAAKAAELARLKAIADEDAAAKVRGDAARAAYEKAEAEKAAAAAAAAAKLKAEKDALISSSTCPAPDMRILLASGDLKAAGELQVGDVVRTQHEHTLEWGDYPVTHASVVPNAERLKFKFDNVDFVCSLDHKFFKAADKWVDAKDVSVGDMISGQTVRGIEQAEAGDVIRITIDDAHTYICEGLLSHNKSKPYVPPTAEELAAIAAAAAKAKAEADAIAAAAKAKLDADAAAAANTVSTIGTVDLGTDTSVKLDKTDSTSTGLSTLADTNTGKITSNVITDGTYAGTTGTAAAIGTKVGKGVVSGTGSETSTGTTGPIIDFTGASAFSTSPLTLAKTQIAEQAAATAAADKTKLNLYSQWGASNPNATEADHANFIDKIGLKAETAAQLLNMSPQQAKNMYYNAKYNKMSGDSAEAYNFLMGKGAYPTKSGVGEIMRPYGEATLGMPASTNKKMLYDPATRSYKANPDYVGSYRDSTGEVNYTMSPNEIFDYFKANAGQKDSETYDWAIENNLSPEEIASALGAPLSEVAARWRDAKAKKVKEAEATKAEADKAAAATAKTTLDSSSTGGNATGGLMKLAMGGMPMYAVGGGLGALGSYSDGGRLLKGPGDGVSDSIPATIGQKQQPARLADGEFVVPARIVSELGNGSTEAGAKKLYAMMDRVQRARGKTTGKNKVAANSRADKHLPA